MSFSEDPWDALSDPSVRGLGSLSPELVNLVHHSPHRGLPCCIYALELSLGLVPNITPANHLLWRTSLINDDDKYVSVFRKAFDGLSGNALPDRPSLFRVSGIGVEDVCRN